LLDGLKKLNETNNLVASMKADLARLQPELESKAAATADLLVKVRCDHVLPAADSSTMFCSNCAVMAWHFPQVHSKRGLLASCDYCSCVASPGSFDTSI
jgi:hypothetical protein